MSAPERERLAAIDIGTNSVLLVIATRDGDALVERESITRLGERVGETGRLSDAALERTLACLQAYARELDGLPRENVAVVATSAARDASNGAVFRERAAEVLGVAPEIVTGAREAELTFFGAVAGLEARVAQADELCVFDIGGGSTEWIVGTMTPTPALRAAASLDVGSVRLTERFVRTDPPSAEALERVAEAAREALAPLPRPSPGAAVVGVAGTVTTLAAFALGLPAYEAARVHGSDLSRLAVEDALARLAQMTSAERERAGIPAGRADVIVQGAVLTRELLAFAGAERCVVSDRGVRWGLLRELGLRSAARR